MSRRPEDVRPPGGNDRPGRPGAPNGPGGGGVPSLPGGDQSWRWVLAVLGVLVVLALVLSPFFDDGAKAV